MADQKLKLLYLAKVLEEKTDDNHYLTTAEIIDELQKYDISCDRKILPHDIEALQMFGYDIICERSQNKSYHIGSRVFQLPELKLLVDAVASSHFITQKKSRQLIKSLQTLTSKHEAKYLQRQVFVSDRIKTQNEHVYLNIDSIHNAIIEMKKVTFRYFDYDIAGNKVYRHDGNRYTVSPYGLTWVDENYYMIGYYEARGQICHFRVDKMERLKISDDRQIYMNEDTQFNVAEYVKKVFHMYGGEFMTVELQFDNSLLNVALDRFGNEAHLRVRDADSFVAQIEVCVSPTFLSWVFQFGDKIKMLSPDVLIENMKKACNDQLSRY